MIYQISAGQGPAECELGVAKLLTYLQSNFDVSVLDSSPGWHRGTYRSVRIYTEADLSDFIGSVRWTCRSPYRPEHRRKNWFIDFSVCTVAKMERFDPGKSPLTPFEAAERAGRTSIRSSLASVQSICLRARLWCVLRSGASTQISRGHSPVCGI